MLNQQSNGKTPKTGTRIISSDLDETILPYERQPTPQCLLDDIEETFPSGCKILESAEKRRSDYEKKFPEFKEIYLKYCKGGKKYTSRYKAIYNKWKKINSKLKCIAPLTFWEHFIQREIVNFDGTYKELTDEQWEQVEHYFNADTVPNSDHNHSIDLDASQNETNEINNKQESSEESDEIRSRTSSGYVNPMTPEKPNFSKKAAQSVYVTAEISPHIPKSTSEQISDIDSLIDTNVVPKLLNKRGQAKFEPLYDCTKVFGNPLKLLKTERFNQQLRIIDFNSPVTPKNLQVTTPEYNMPSISEMEKFKNTSINNEVPTIASESYDKKLEELMQDFENTFNQEPAEYINDFSTPPRGTDDVYMTMSPLITSAKTSIVPVLPYMTENMQYLLDAGEFTWNSKMKSPQPYLKLALNGRSIWDHRTLLVTQTVQFIEMDNKTLRNAIPNSRVHAIHVQANSRTCDHSAVRGIIQRINTKVFGDKPRLPYFYLVYIEPGVTQRYQVMLFYSTDLTSKNTEINTGISSPVLTFRGMYNIKKALKALNDVQDPIIKSKACGNNQFSIRWLIGKGTDVEQVNITSTVTLMLLYACVNQIGTMENRVNYFVNGTQPEPIADSNIKPISGENIDLTARRMGIGAEQAGTNNSIKDMRDMVNFARRDIGQIYDNIVHLTMSKLHMMIYAYRYFIKIISSGNQYTKYLIDTAAKIAKHAELSLFVQKEWIRNANKEIKSWGNSTVLESLDDLHLMITNRMNTEDFGPVSCSMFGHGTLLRGAFIMIWSFIVEYDGMSALAEMDTTFNMFAGYASTLTLFVYGMDTLTDKFYKILVNFRTIYTHLTELKTLRSSPLSNKQLESFRTNIDKNLHTFFYRLFNIDYEKVMILILAGVSNSGKSFATKSLKVLFQSFSGIVLGSKITDDFLRVNNLCRRYLKIFEEYKGNILKEFQFLETNGKQLYKNNVTPDNRIQLTILCVDKPKYNLDTERDELRKESFGKPVRSYRDMDFTKNPSADVDTYKDDETLILEDSQSRRDQVNNRACIIRLNDPCIEKMIDISKTLFSVAGDLANLMSKSEIAQPQIDVTSDACYLVDSNDLSSNAHYGDYMKYLCKHACWVILLQPVIEAVGEQIDNPVIPAALRQYTR